MEPKRLYGSSMPRFAVAPMIDWTDRHCRFFHRQLTRSALLYTEMIVADAAIHGDRERLLGFSEAEHPVALQLGGSDPAKLAEAARIGEGFGYDEIGLNVGCPSDRVQSGAFGACLMADPALVARCVEAMRGAVSIPVTVKCRIGIDEDDPSAVLPAFASQIRHAGADALWVHARKAWLKGLSPKENRTIPPLDHALVHALKRDHPDWFIGINGGIATLAEVRGHLASVDGVMVGRAAYGDPGLLGGVDEAIYGHPASGLRSAADYEPVVESMIDYAASHLARGGRLSAITRHMVGLFTGLPGARRWRQILSTQATDRQANAEVIRRAYEAVQPADALEEEAAG